MSQVTKAPNLSAGFGAEVGGEDDVLVMGGSATKTEARAASAVGDDGIRYSAPSVGETNGETKRSSDGGKAPDAEIFFSELLSAGSDTVLSQDGEDYLTQLRKLLGEDGFNVTRLSGTGAYLIDNPKLAHAVAVYFSECTPKSNRPFAPYTKFIPKIQNEIDNRQPGVRLMDTILITPNDYPRVKQMSSMLGNLLKYTFTGTATLKNMQKFTYRLTTDQTRAMAHLKQTCPHGVLPNTQYAVSMEIAKLPDSRNDRYYRDDDDRLLEYMPLFTVGGSTEFYYDDDRRANRPPFIPIVSITTCAIQYTALQFLPMVIAAAYLGFIDSELYLEPFKNFGDVGPNLGELIRVNNKATRLRSVGEYRDALPAMLDRPLLAVEATEGRLEYPGLYLLSSEDGMSMLKEQLLTNFDDSPLIDEIPTSMVAAFTEFYTGTVNVNGELRDSRSVDYFSVCEHQTDDRLLSRFLGYSSRPEDRMQLLQDCGYNTTMSNGREGLTSLYSTYKFILNGQSVSKFLSVAYNLDMLVTNSDNRNSVFNPDKLRGIGTSLHDLVGSRPSFESRRFRNNDSRSYRSQRMGAFSRRGGLFG